MTPAEISAVLEQKFGTRIKSKNLDAIDPFVVIEPGDLLEFCRFLKTDSRLQFDILNCISGVDYLEPDPKKAPKAGFDPHMEVVYHLSSFRSAVGGGSVANGRLARARGLRPERRLVHRASGPDAHFAGRRLGWSPAPERLRVPAGISRHPRSLTVFLPHATPRRLWPP
jgi:hypothetical protein